MSDQLDGQELLLRNVNLVDAKAHLSKLVEWAAAGDTVRITRRGKPVAQITAVQTPRKRIDLSTLRALTGMMPVQRIDPRPRSSATGPGALLMLYLDTSLLVAPLTNETETGLMQAWLGEQELSEIRDWVIT
jgi:prevent-host-death family protein